VRLRIANPRIRRWLGFEETIWTRKVADAEVRRLVARLDPATLDALEVSGEVWRTHGFKSYQRAVYPAFDICAEPLPQTFDLVIAEHVLEHVLRPARAVRNVHAMLRPGGHFLVVTPFLYRYHPCPEDCTRWSETGMKHLLADAGFPMETIETGSWGNRACLEATFRREFRAFNRFLHTLRNDPELPMVVWALARK
jgi:SAM-dependent methyltransferase